MRFTILWLPAELVAVLTLVGVCLAASHAAAADCQFLPADSQIPILSGFLVDDRDVQADRRPQFVSACGPDIGQPPAASGSFQLTAYSVASPHDDLGDGSHWAPCGNAIPTDCCDCEPNRSLDLFFGYDAWRGVADDSWENNGLHTGLNFGTRLGQFSELTGVGFQVGGSVGVYDLTGTDYRPNPGAVQTQGFVTYGFFRRATADCRWSAAIVQDWMLNDNFGEYGENPTLSQFRGQIGYVVNDANEIGVWGALRCLGDTRDVPAVGSTTWRPIDQADLFWHHHWELGADTTIGFGLPESRRLGAAGSLGDYIAYASASVPLNDRFALYSLVSYMHPSASRGAAGADEDAWAFIIGVAFYPGRNARSNTVAGQRWSPLMPLANNGNFFVDVSQ